MQRSSLGLWRRVNCSPRQHDQRPSADVRAFRYDAYGRIIARCLPGEHDLGREMAALGLAWAYLEYSKDYVEVETGARSQGLGIWQGTAQATWEYRANRWERAVADALDGCPIRATSLPRVSASITRPSHRPIREPRSMKPTASAGSVTKPKLWRPVGGRHGHGSDWDVTRCLRI